MTTQNIVRATHLECVDGDHNKYYRTYLITPRPELNISTVLLRNWGRRGAPAGQWMRSSGRGKRAEVQASDIEWEKTSKGYLEIQTSCFDVPDTFVHDSLRDHHKVIGEDVQASFTSAFETQWCADILVDPLTMSSKEYLVWISDWAATTKARTPARNLETSLAGRILFHDKGTDIAVVRAVQGELISAQAAFDSVEYTAAETTDDHDTARVANRLWSPTSSGPYRTLSTAVRDARRLFKRN